MTLQSHSDRQSAVVFGVASFYEVPPYSVYICVSVCEWMTQSQWEPQEGIWPFTVALRLQCTYRKVEDHVTGKWKEDVRMEGHRGKGMAGKAVEAQ